MFGVLDSDFVFGPGVAHIHLGHSLRVCDGEPARTADLSLQNKKLKHGLLAAEHRFESVAGEPVRHGWHSGWILDLEQAVLSVRQRHLKAVLASHALALPLCDLLHSTFSNLFELGKHIGEEFVFFLLGQGTARFVPFDLGQHVNTSFHALHLQGTRDVRVDLRLPNFAENVDLRSILLLVCVDPEKVERTVRVQRQRQVLSGLKCSRGGLVVHELVLNLEFFPVVLERLMLGRLG